MKKLIIIGLILLFPSTCFAVDYTQDANCQAAWLMNVNENPITDSSQNTNTGAAAGDPTWSNAAPAAGYSAGYWIFDQVVDRFDVTNNASLDPGGDFSIVAWVFLVSYGDNSFGRILDNLNIVGNDAGWSFYVNDSTATDALALNLGAGTGGTTVINSDNSIMSTGSWLHVAVVLDTIGDDVTFYVGGVADGGHVVTVIPAASAIDTTIGDRDDNARQFDGRMDEVAFFDRTLSQAEVQDIMNNGLGVGGGSPAGGETSKAFWIN